MHFLTIFVLLSVLSSCVITPSNANNVSKSSRIHRTKEAPRGFLSLFFKKVMPNRRYNGPNSYSVRGQTYKVMRSSGGYKARGIASWYGNNFHQRRTSSGDRYNMYAMTAAHKTLPLHTYVRVKNLKNGRVVVVKINDRGPFHSNRVIDLSYAAAAKLGIFPSGTAPVELEAVRGK